MFSKKAKKYTSSILLSAVAVFSISQPIFAKADTDVTVITKPIDTQAPTTPSELKIVDKTATTITFSWISSSDNEAVTEYDLYSGTNKIAASDKVTNEQPNQEKIYTIHGLASNTTYTFSVKAKDAAGNISEASNDVTTTTEQLKEPVNLRTTSLTDTSLTLAWTGAPENGGVTSYNIYRGTTFIGTTTGATSYNIIALTPSTSYEFSVKAKDVEGNESPASVPLVVTTNAKDTQPPTTPSGLKYTAKTDTTVSLSWTASTDNVKVTGYDIYSGDTKVATTSSTSYTVTKLTANTPYKFTVKAKDAAGNESPASNELSVTTNPIDTQAPTAPTNLKSTAKTDTTVSLAWTAATDNVRVTGYNIYSGNTKVGTTTSISYTVTKLTANTDYKFTVKAIDAMGNESAASNEVAVTTNPSDTQIPTTPLNLKVVSKTDTTVNLSWTAATDNVRVTGYNIYSGTTLVATTSSTSYSVTKLTASTAYKFTVKAKDAAGNESLASNEVAVTTDAPPAPDTEAPTAPTNVVSTGQTETTVSLAWTAATDNVKVTGYNIYCGGKVIASPTSTSVTITGLTAETQYTFTVTAKDAAGNESKAAYVEADKLPPTAPTNLRAATKTYTTVSLAWTPSTDNVKVKEYTIYSGDTIIAKTPSTSYIVTGLTAGATYKYKVIATDAEGNQSAASNELAVTTTVDKQAPTVPTNLVSTAQKDTSVSLSWTASTDNVGVKEYNIYSGETLVGTTPSTSFTVTGLTAGTSYKFKVKAKDAVGNESAASNEVAVTTTLDSQAPTTPTNLIVAAKTDTSVSLSWTASTDNVGVDRYYIYSGSTLIGSTASTSYKVTGLKATTGYKFTVRAKDAAGNKSALSTVLTVTTNAPDTQAPTAPTNLVVAAKTDTTVSLSWAASTDNVGVAKYYIYSGTTLVGSTSSTSFNVTGLKAGTYYKFTVRAKDTSGNRSSISKAVSVTTNVQAATSTVK